MRIFCLIAALSLLPVSGFAHQDRDKQAACHENASGFYHCHLSQD